jgi:hypothetical protein
LLALAVYPVEPHHTILLVRTSLFLVFFVTAVWMFQEMSRDSILSRTTNTEAGQMDLAFYAHGQTIQTLEGASSLASTGIDDAEAASGVGLVKLGYDGLSYAAGLFSCATN